MKNVPRRLKSSADC